MYYGNDKELEALLERSTELPEMGYYDYDWEIFASYYDPTTRMFYWVEGGGCSCNDLWDDVHTVGDMSVGRKEELLRAAAVFCDGRYESGFQSLRSAVEKLNG